MYKLSFLRAIDLKHAYFFFFDFKLFIIQSCFNGRADSPVGTCCTVIVLQRSNNTRPPTHVQSKIIFLLYYILLLYIQDVENQQIRMLNKKRN